MRTRMVAQSIGTVLNLRTTTFTEMCSGSKAGSYLRLIFFVYHSTLGLRVTKQMKRSNQSEAHARHTAGMGRSFCFAPILALLSFKICCLAERIDFWQPLPRLWIHPRRLTDFTTLWYQSSPFWFQTSPFQSTARPLEPRTVRILNIGLLSLYQQFGMVSQYAVRPAPRHQMSGRISIGEDGMLDFYERRCPLSIF